MSEKSKSNSPPYATFSSLMGFLNKLRDSAGIPSRIDPSVFGNASGSIVYSIIAALKFLGLIDDAGTPSNAFKELVSASDEDRIPLLKKAIEAGYPSLFDGTIQLSTMTAGQFDEHFRDVYSVKGSTVDKIASFFISAAQTAQIPLSNHLLSRRSSYASSAAQKSAKQRKKTSSDEAAPNGSGQSSAVPQVPSATTHKALEYQLIDLMSEPDIDGDVKNSIWSLVQYLTARKAKNKELG
jgi:Family of unknown function (DUF5343)